MTPVNQYTCIDVLPAVKRAGCTADSGLSLRYQTYSRWNVFATSFETSRWSHSWWGAPPSVTLIVVTLRSWLQPRSGRSCAAWQSTQDIRKLLFTILLNSIHLQTVHITLLLYYSGMRSMPHFDITLDIDRYHILRCDYFL